MSRWLSCFCALLLLPTMAAAQQSRDVKRARELQVRQTVEKIKTDCGITTGQFSYDAGSISLHYDGMIEPEKLDCASQRSILLGIDFDSYDSSAPYSGPRRFIIKGPSKRLMAIEAEAVSSHWTVTHRADAQDGVTFLEVEPANTATRREVRAFLDRFIMGDFRDVAVGLAPVTLAGHDLPSTAMEFRSSARRMYHQLNLRSCGAPPGFDREAQLKPDRDAVSLLERELSGSSAAGHLAIAREDAAFRQSKESGCWADDDVRFAQRHVDMVHQAVSSGTARLKELASAVDPLPAMQAPANAAEFRYEVGQLIEWTLPLCRWTSKGSNDEVLAAARAQIALFENRLRGTRYEKSYAIAKEDATYERSQVTAECDDPDADPVAKVSAEAVASVKKQIAQIEKLMLP